MIKVIQQTPKGPELTNFDLRARATIGKGLVTSNLKLSKQPEAPKFIRPVDMRPSNPNCSRNCLGSNRYPQLFESIDH